MHRLCDEVILVRLCPPSGAFFQLFRPFVHGFAQGLARLEVGHPLFRNGHTFPAAGVAAHAGRAVVDGEAAKAPDFDAVAAHQRVAHGLQDVLDRRLRIAVRELAKTGCQFFHQVGSGHGASGSNRRYK